MFERLAKGLDRADLIADPRFKDNVTRVKNNADLDPIIANEIKSRTCEENMRIIEAGGVTAIPIYDIEDILSDPHFQERELVTSIPDQDFGGSPDAASNPQDVRNTT